MLRTGSPGTVYVMQSQGVLSASAPSLLHFLFGSAGVQGRVYFGDVSTAACHITSSAQHFVEIMEECPGGGHVYQHPDCPKLSKNQGQSSCSAP